MNRMGAVFTVALLATSLAACGGSSQSAKAKSPSDTFIASFNKNAMSLGPHATSSSDKKQVIKLGKDFCAAMRKNSDDDKAAMKAIERQDNVPKTMASVIFLAATDEGSLCPVGN